jgi:hypothetical protein
LTITRAKWAQMKRTDKDNRYSKEASNYRESKYSIIASELL